MILLYIVIGLVIVLGLSVVGIYNSLVTFSMRVKEAWADIDVQLKRRYDLIPNLVNTVKGSTNFETSTLEKVIAARSNALGATTPKEAGVADVAMRGALSGFFALAESYPDLKSNQNFISLQNELSDTENKIQAARRFYNGVVMDYNTKIQTVPTNIFANMFSYTASEFFELEEGEQAARNPVEVKF
ncbi:MAG: LemA family protein [Candidatus Nomurabacteria bacterium]|nr:LemA family protein [Candidatus Nomurabacteria bacterium]